MYVREEIRPRWKTFDRALWKIVRVGPPLASHSLTSRADSGNAKYPYFFGSAQQLAVGMRTAMRVSAPKSDEL